jgi:hypothetical protein
MSQIAEHRALEQIAERIKEIGEAVRRAKSGTGESEAGLSRAQDDLRAAVADAGRDDLPATTALAEADRETLLDGKLEQPALDEVAALLARLRGT